MRKKAGLLFVFLGVVLIGSALLLYLYNGEEERRAGQEAELLLGDVLAAIEEKKKSDDSQDESVNGNNSGTEDVLQEGSSLAGDTPEDTLTGNNSQNTGTGGENHGSTSDENHNRNNSGSSGGNTGSSSTVTIGDYDYIGYISIPDIGLKLPIISEWNYDRLKIAPCRHFGSTGTDDLVIAGHNYKTHFGPIGRLPVGTEVIVTDMDGTEHHYAVEDKTTLSPESVEEVQNSGYDLVLYTCKLGGENRIVVFCDRIS